MSILRELVEQFGMDGWISGWIVPGKGFVSTDGMRHGQAIFLDPQAFGLTDEVLEPFCPNLARAREMYDQQEREAEEKSTLLNWRQSDIELCVDENDGEWSNMYKMLYQRGMLRVQISDDASFSGRGADFLAFAQQGSIQRVLKGYTGRVHLSLMINGTVQERTFELQRGATGEFWRGVKQFASE